MDTLHITEDGRQMLDLVDELRSITKIEKSIPLPQIVVVGQQSCGKSSVLNAISGIQFPTDEGLCTQFPIEIILRREYVISARASIRYSADATDQEKKGYQDFENTWCNASLEDLSQIISSAKDVLKLSEGRGFSSQSLVLEVCGPDQEHLTLIDLPGYFHARQVGQSPEDIGLVENLADLYVNKERAIVLAVVTGKNDLENQLILEKLMNNAELRDRTLGVITAPDTVPRNSKREQQCMELLQTDPRKLRYGWHVLRNLSREEVIEGNVVRDEQESIYFERTAPWNMVESKKAGSKNLKKRLSSLLTKSISLSLPVIRDDVNEKLRLTDAKLMALGKPRSSPGAIQEYLCRTAKLFKTEVDILMGESWSHTNFRELGDCPSLRSFVQSQYLDFVREMHEKGRVWRLTQHGDEDSKRAEQVISGNSANTEEVSENAMVDFILDKIQQNRVRDLPNCFGSGWESMIFRYQSKRWIDIARKFANRIFLELDQRLLQAIRKVADEEIAEKLIEAIVSPALQQRKQTLDLKLEELYKPYSTSGIFSTSMRYYDVLRAHGCASYSGDVPWPQNKCREILLSAEAFYDIAIEVYMENFAYLGIENCLLFGLDEILSQSHFLGEHATSDYLEELGGESPEIRERRHILSLEKEQFEQARDLILQGRSLKGTTKCHTNVANKDDNEAFPARYEVDHEPSQYLVTVSQPTPPVTPTRDRKSRSKPSRTRDNSRSSFGSDETTSAASESSSPHHTRSTSSVSSLSGSILSSPLKFLGVSARAASIPGGFEADGSSEDIL